MGQSLAAEQPLSTSPPFSPREVPLVTGPPASAVPTVAVTVEYALTKEGQALMRLEGDAEWQFAEHTPGRILQRLKMMIPKY